MAVWKLEIEGRTYRVDVQELGQGTATVVVDGRTYELRYEQEAAAPGYEPAGDAPSLASVPAGPAPSAGGLAPHGVVTSPLPGMVLAVFVKPGDRVREGQVVVKIEAMKMENEIRSKYAGTVKEVFVEKGETVLEGAHLLRVG